MVAAVKKVMIKLSEPKQTRINWNYGECITTYGTMVVGFFWTKLVLCQCKIRVRTGLWWLLWSKFSLRKRKWGKALKEAMHCKREKGQRGRWAVRHTHERDIHARIFWICFVPFGMLGFKVPFGMLGFKEWLQAFYLAQCVFVSEVGVLQFILDSWLFSQEPQPFERPCLLFHLVIQPNQLHQTRDIRQSAA